MPTPLATTAPPPPISRKEMRPVKYHYADTFWCTYIISVISANIAELGKYPESVYSMKWQQIHCIGYFIYKCSERSVDCTPRKMFCNGEMRLSNVVEFASEYAPLI